MGQLDAVLGNPATRRTFLKGVGALGAGGVLAACRKNVDAGASGNTTTASIVPIEQEPGVLKAYEWAGYDTNWLFADYLKAGYEDPKFSFFVNTEGALAKTAAGLRLGRHPPRERLHPGLRQHGRDTALGHLADPELLEPEPGDRSVRADRRQAVRDRAGLGILRPA